MSVARFDRRCASPLSSSQMEAAETLSIVLLKPTMSAVRARHALRALFFSTQADRHLLRRLFYRLD